MGGGQRGRGGEKIVGERESVGRRKNNECMKGIKVSKQHREERQKGGVEGEKKRGREKRMGRLGYEDRKVEKRRKNYRSSKGLMGKREKIMNEKGRGLVAKDLMCKRYTSTLI
jgi:hypothetical protein